MTAARQAADAAAAARCTRWSSVRPVSRARPSPGPYGADVVTVVEHAGLERYSPEVVRRDGRRADQGGRLSRRILRRSAQGRDLAPRVAAKLGVGARIRRHRVRAHRRCGHRSHPAYTGKVIATCVSPGTPALVSIRPGAVTAAEPPRPRRSKRRRRRDPGIGAGGSDRADPARPAATRSRRSAHDRERWTGTSRAENFKLVEDLAAAFGNAAVGATRAVTDDGWRPHSEQIGQTDGM